jgi:hypothetical protein
MKIERTYRWRVTNRRGKSHVTFGHLTEAQVRRDYPECEFEAQPDTLIEEKVPETDAEMTQRWVEGKSPYGPSSSLGDSK